MQKQNDSLEFFQRVHFEFSESFKNNSTKYLVIFDNSCEEIGDPNHTHKLSVLGKYFNHFPKSANVIFVIVVRERLYSFSANS